MKRTITLKGRTIEYTLERKRVKNLNLRVRGGEVFVSASRLVPLAVVESFLRSRADFILGALARTEKTAFPPCEDGAALPYRGGTLRLSLGCAPRSSVTRDGALLRVELRDPDEGESVRRALEKWYRGESERLCRAYLEALCPRFAALGVPAPELRMRAMRSQWGNCRPARRIVTFNARLAAVPDGCIEYVVAHELCHFLHADHSSAFYSALARVLPDWKHRRAALRKYSSLL